MDCQQLQVAWFTMNEAVPQAADCFSKLLGQQPEQSVSNKTMSPQAPFLSRASGSYEAKNVIFQVTPGRLDLFVENEFVGNDLTPPPAFSTFKFCDITQKLISLMNERDFSIAKCYRQALVSHFVTPVSNRGEANDLFVKYTGTTSVKPDDIDLLFQKNTRSRSNSGVIINNLQIHRVEEVQTFSFGSQPQPNHIFLGHQIVPGAPLRVDRAYKMTTDVNSHPDGSMIEAGQQIVNLNDMFESTLSIKEALNV